MNAIAELRALLLESAEGVMPDVLAVETQLLIRVLGEYSALKSELRDERLTGLNARVGRSYPAQTYPCCGRVRCVCVELRAM